MRVIGIAENPSTLLRVRPELVEWTNGPVSCLRLVLAVSLAIGIAQPSAAQERPTGYISTFVDFFPHRADAVELRARVFAEQKAAPSDRIRLTLSGFAEGLVARRPGHPAVRPGDGVRDAIASLQDASVEVAMGRVDLLAGFTRVAWGRLDELQPTDVINPLDVSRFFFEGRSEARLPVALVRGRLFITDDMALEAVYVPAFRRGHFDRLDEPTSPFNLATDLNAVSLDDREPAVTFGNAQGGARFSATTRRVDWAVSAFRGFEAFGLYTAVPPPASAVVRTFPRYTMVGADFETVRGEWGVRGEVAAFVRDSFQGPLSIVSGRSYDAGLGVDRKAGDYRISGTALVHHEPSHTDFSLILSSDRSFAREKYSVRVFGVYGATEGSGFLRGIATAKLRDNVALEGSAGWFAGDGRDLAGRFRDSDFTYARLKYYW
jgi:hypothetical protein